MANPAVLLIEDDHSLRRVTEFTLEEAGYRVYTADDGVEGLRLFSSLNPDLVITDLQMPGMSGMEVLKGIKAENPRALIIVITAFGTVENAVEAMKIGAFDFIAKPFGRDHLRLIVAKALSFSHLQKENTQLKERLGAMPRLPVIASSDRMQEVLSLSRRVAASEATVLITGESGTGKEVIARTIHESSERRDGAFVPINCAAIPSELLESELFGHIKGAFTGAVRDRKGKFQLADGGTLFLDEIGDLPLELQPKLLRALQEREVEPVGGRLARVDVRVVAATNRDLEEAMAQGKFREDLYYRLAVVPIHIPPLRQRPDDIPALIAHFLHKYGKGKTVAISDKAVRALVAYDWPGNVRELENAIERMLVLSTASLLDVDDLPPRIRLNSRRPPEGLLNIPDSGYSLEALEKEAILDALTRHDWNRTRAAAFLQIHRHVLVYRLEKYGIVKGKAEKATQ